MTSAPDIRIFLTGYIDIPETLYATVMAALPTHVALTRAERGCLTFEVSEDNAVSGRLRVFEIFKDQTAFDAHQLRTQQSQWYQITREIPRHFQTAVGHPPETR
ncbi:Antibiotic biosynthesis monooxygenase [Epibacterium ulvae]|uniref:Antibiotic biosynthesis monooxygenase n=1 Tax=Epibacterium ulvae TaxID=1156985 RepID=A0A1G5PWG0_9RHOB|nr:antibiotic biosynthesis monooxygenase [Epibacterium ulvae]SCZ53531.1 Antibiotic biosynthesis monooxygenase [Epibacterium ulvae]